MQRVKDVHSPHPLTPPKAEERFFFFVLVGRVPTICGVVSNFPICVFFESKVDKFRHKMNFFFVLCTSPFFAANFHLVYDPQKLLF